MNVIFCRYYSPTFNKGTTPAAIRQAFANANKAADYLRALTPNSGAYQNEAAVSHVAICVRSDRS